MPVLSSNVRQGLVLSRQEMCFISQTINREFSPRLFGSRVARSTASRFSPQELRDISQQISREYAPSKTMRQSKLVLMAVSPRRLHAYWHIAKRRLNEALQQNDEAQPLTLRIYAEDDTNDLPLETPTHDRNWFDVPVTRVDGQQDIWLPEPLIAHSGRQYRAELGELNARQVFSPRVTSNAAQTAQICASNMLNALPDAVAQFIITDSHSTSSIGKTASGQGK